MPLTYTTYVNQVANLMAVATTDPNFTTFLPGCIDYAEQRLYRDLNMLNTTVTDTSVTLSANARTTALPSSVTGSTDGFRTITAVSVVDGSSTRRPLSRSWQGAIDFLYPSNTSSAAGSMPALYAVIGSTAIATPGPATLMVGPPAGTAYTLEITGTARPTTLSVSNTATLLTDAFPDLFLAASMIFATGFQRDFGAQSDDPRMGASWESQYKLLLESAIAEQERQRYSVHLNKGTAAAEGGQ